MKFLKAEKAEKYSKAELIYMHNLIVEKAKALEKDNDTLLKIQNKIKVAQIETRLLELKAYVELYPDGSFHCLRVGRQIEALEAELKKLREN